MNLTHPNYGQNYRLTRAALRLGTFSVSELMDVTGALKNTVYSFVSKIRQIDEGFLDAEQMQTLRDRPQKRYSLTETGTKYLGGLSFEMASRFGEATEQSNRRRQWSRDESKDAESIALPSDIYEEERELVVQVEVPGLSVEDLDVHLEQNDLVVSGERPAMSRGGGATPYMVERQRGRFFRSYPLPETFEAKITNIEVRNGVLEVIVSRSAAAHLAVAAALGQSGSPIRSKKTATAVFHQFEESAE